jgi:hypothetical protein
MTTCTTWSESTTGSGVAGSRTSRAGLASVKAQLRGSFEAGPESGDHHLSFGS